MGVEYQRGNDVNPPARILVRGQEVNQLVISEIACGLKWVTELVVDGALEAVNSELRPLDRWS